MGIDLGVNNALIKKIYVLFELIISEKKIKIKFIYAMLQQPPDSELEPLSR